MNNTRFIVAGYVESIADQIEGVIDYLYENSEASVNEAKSSDLIIGILSDEGFKITRSPGGIDNSFIASYGSSEPRIAYICEYGSGKGFEHSYGYNVSSAVNMGAGIGLKRIVDEIGGSVLIIGCPSGDMSSTKITMLNNGVFNDIDAVICSCAMDKTCESGSSLGMSILKLGFKGREAPVSIDLQDGIDALKPCILVFNLAETIKSKYKSSIYINGVINNGGKSVNYVTGEADCTFMLKSHDPEIIDNACRELLASADFASKLCKCILEYDYPEVRYLPLKTHEKLSKIACHNLKESGIIEVHGPVTASTSLDIGNLSHKIPVIYPYIGICEASTPCSSKEFSEATVTGYARDNALKAAKALALTGVDIIQNPDILKI